MANSALLLSTDADLTGEVFDLPLSRLQKLCQISITGTQTVTLEGRIDATHDWYTIKTTSADAMFLFTAPNLLRATSSATSTGSNVTTVVW